MIGSLRDQTRDPDYLLTDYEVPIHPSLIRPILWMGAERRIVIFNTMIVLIIIVALDFRLWPSLFLIAIGTGVHLWAVWLAKKDPHAGQIFVRSRYYQDWYPARAMRQAPTPRVRYTGVRR